jgi:putative Holliday junction resolvase
MPSSSEEGRVLGIDPGTKRIGFAISDELQLFARPLEVWTRKKRIEEDTAHVLALVQEHEVVRVVVGVPYRLDGTKGQAAEKALLFIDALTAVLPETVAIEARDEALTTWEAESRLKARGLLPKERRELVDAFAAAVILQEALDANATSTPRS